MATRSPAALLRALGRADLLHLLSDPAATTDVSVHDGTRHARYGCARARSGTSTTVSYLSVLHGEHACPDPECVHTLAEGWCASDLVRGTILLLDACDLARSAQRHVQDPTKSTVPDKAGKLRSALSSKVDAIGVSQMHGRGAAFAAAAERVTGACYDAMTALDAIATSPALVEKILARVRDELIPGNLRGRVNLDCAPVLAGVISRSSPPRKVGEVINAFAVGGTSPCPLLACPRYVADYVNRFYTAGSSASLVLLTVPADDLDATHRAAIARLWDPRGAGPLVDLSAAVEAARMCLASPAEVAG